MSDKEKIINEIQRRINLFRKDGKLGSDTEIALYGLINFINALQEEPVSDDLEIAACQSFNSACEDLNKEDKDSATYLKEYFKELWMCAFKDGAHWNEKQIMNNAIDGYIDQVEYPGSTLIQLSENPKDFNNGEDVKVIIIKK
jgi:hypothetical protein